MKLNKKPTAIDLFSGSGGLSEGFIQAGFHVIAAVDSDPFATETQRFNHTRHKHYRTEVLSQDIRHTKGLLRNLYALGVKKADIIIGGPPCQGFSRANRQAGSQHHHLNQLFWKFVNIVDVYKPYVVVLENVGDLSNFKNGEVATDILFAFQDLHYKVEIYILNAINFGVPQNRKRIFFVATRKGIKIEYPRRRCVAPKDFVTVWEAISDLPSLNNGAREDELKYRRNRNLTPYQKRMRTPSNGHIRNNYVTLNNELVIERYSHIPQGGNWRDIPERLMENYTDKERCHQWIYRRLPENEPSITITNFRKNMLIHPRQDRGLSVREAARIQSFPDRFIFRGSLESQQQQVANAVPPLMARAVAKSVRRMLGR